MHWKEIITGVIIGVILALGGMFFTFEQRITKLETAIYYSQKLKRKTLLKNENNSSLKAAPLKKDFPKVRLIFSTSLNEKSLPVDSIENLAIEESLLVFTFLHDLVIHNNYVQKWEIYNQHGDIVFQK